MLQLLKLSWNNCGSKSSPVKLNKFTLKPNPLKVPGNVTVLFNFSVAMNLTAPLKVRCFYMFSCLLLLSVSYPSVVSAVS